MQPRPLPDEIGRYRVVRLLGQGAMGRVLLARDPVLDRDVAVKLLRDDLGLLDEQRRTLLDRMRQEARASARVSHPNIVALFDMGEDPALGLFLVFEYVSGQTLKKRLDRGPMGPVGGARLAREIGAALTTAHGAGVLHRDIKPENIILSEVGAKIADFGIARVPDSTLTLTGRLIGTPAYSAPEALANGKFSPRSDQFSLAATLYEALSGYRAFPGDDAISVTSRIATEEPPGIARACGLDPHVDTVLARGLAKKPADRFDSCEELGKALAEALEIAPRSTQPTLPDERHLEVDPASLLSTRPAAPVRRAAAGGAAVGALLTIAGFQLTAQLRHEPLPVAPAEASESARTAAQSEARPVAWLAERPTPAPRRARKRRVPVREAAVETSTSRDDAGPDASGTAAGERSAAAARDGGAPRLRDAGGTEAGAGQRSSR